MRCTLNFSATTAEFLIFPLNFKPANLFARFLSRWNLKMKDKKTLRLWNRRFRWSSSICKSFPICNIASHSLFARHPPVCKPFPICKSSLFASNFPICKSFPICTSFPVRKQLPVCKSFPIYKSSPICKSRAMPRSSVLSLPWGVIAPRSTARLYKKTGHVEPTGA